MDNKNFIAHYGILGQRWGRRRSPEELGYRVSKRKEYKQEKSIAKNAKKYSKKEAKIRSKYRTGLTDKNLTDQISRMEKEKKLKQLTSENLNPGRREVSHFLSSNGKKVLGTVLVGASLYGAKKLVEKKFGKEAAEFVSYGGPKKKK